MPHVNKNSLARKRKLVQKNRLRMNYEWSGKTIRKKHPIQKKRETVKIKVEFPHVNKKSLARKRIFVQTQFSHSTLNWSEKILRHKTTRFFAPLPVSAWPKALLQFDFKNNETLWTDLSRQRPIQFKFFELYKKLGALKKPAEKLRRLLNITD